MDVISYALSKKIAAHVVSGVQSMSVNGQTLTINTKDSGVLTMTFPTPKDGVSVTDIDVNANNQIVFTMSDGSEFISGKIPTVKGEPGFSPTITENADNTDKIYKLDITTEDSTFTTPNLKGADGQGGDGGDSSVTLTQEEYEALTEEQKLNGLYYIYDTKRIYKNGVQYGASEPIPLTMAEYEALKEAGAIDEQQEYLIEADDKGILINAEDIGYSNVKSGIQATTVQDAIDKIAENGGSGEKNVQSDWNETDDTADGFIKNKPTIPEAYDDTALSNRVKTIEDDYAKSSDIPSLSGYATETWVNEQGFLTQHQDISNLVQKEDGKTLISTEDISQIAQNKTDIEILNGAGEGSIEKKIADKLSEQTYLTKEIATADEVAAYITDPTTAKFNVIYLVKDESVMGVDKYFEYQRIGNEESSSFQMTGDTSTDLSDYAKSADIPTSLPADGGNADTVNNHTVKSDVPENAVFTDTIYDDTNIKNELNSKANTADLSIVATSGSYNDLSGKPTIPPAVTVDAAMSSTSTNPVQNKVVNEALGTKASSADLISHTENKNNPHGVTKEQVGLGNVENKSSETIRSELNLENVENAVGFKYSDCLEKLVYYINSGSSHRWKAINIELVGKNASFCFDFILMSRNDPYPKRFSVNLKMDGTVGVANSGTFSLITEDYDVNNMVAYLIADDDGTQHVEIYFTTGGWDACHIYLEKIFNQSNCIITFPKVADGNEPTTYVSKVTPVVKNKGGAEKATKDASGNVITDTYALKSKYGDTTINVGRQSGTTVGEYSTAEGYYTVASGSYSHAEGKGATSSGYCSHAEGYYTVALNNQHAQGHYNNQSTATENSDTGTSSGTAFVIGNGTLNSKSNAFRVTGQGETIAKKAYSTTGADYAEYFEWEDGNENKEDRRGLFVTIKCDKIKIANESDYILGIVSALPSVIGNHDEEWMGRYILDDFGAFITEKFEYEEKEIDQETGEEKTIIKTGTKWKENPDYDSEKPYTPRAERPEWDAIGMLGVLNVIDDGSCKVNGFCKVVDGGTATASDTGYRVIKRVTDNIVKIVFR